jgi:hypothetical protein
MRSLMQCLDWASSWLIDKRTMISWTKWGFVRLIILWSFFLWIISVLVISVLYLPSAGVQEVIRKLLVALPVCVLIALSCVSLGFAGLLICCEMNSARDGATTTTIMCTANEQELRLVLPQRLARSRTKTRNVALSDGRIVIRAHSNFYLLLGYVVLQRQGDYLVCRVLEYPLVKAYGMPATPQVRRGWRLIESVYEVVRGLDPEVIICSDSRRMSARRKAKSGEDCG